MAGVKRTSPSASSLDTNGTTKPGLLERLAAGPVIGDGSFVITLEKRGYVMAGAFTPEAAVQYPEAVKQLHREFLRAGSDVMQTFTFYSSDNNFKVRWKDAEEFISSEVLNRQACDLAREVANEGGALVAGGISPVDSFRAGASAEEVTSEFKKQMEVYIEKDVDFFLGEFFGHVREAELAISAMKGSGKPVACTMRIGLVGDLDGVSTAECAVRMAKAGADVIGINCNYDINICLEAMQIVKDALDKEGLTPYLMAQPLGWHTQDVRDFRDGYMSLPEYPFAMEPRAITRIEAGKFARAAYEMGIHYIGGCCGFEPHHIRAMAEELAPERGKDIPGKDKSWRWDSLKLSGFGYGKTRSNREYWENLDPAAGRRGVKELSEPSGNI